MDILFVFRNGRIQKLEKNYGRFFISSTRIFLVFIGVKKA